MAPTPGILYVTMQPKASLPEAQFHDWYNNEHGPGRLRLAFVQNGFRYRANDLEKQAGSAEKPEWMAMYDIEDMEWLTRDVYTRLRAAPVQSQRERDTMKQIHVDRRFYDLVSEAKGENFKELENVENEGEGNVTVAVFLTLKEGADKEEEVRRWYDEEHIALLRKVTGWRRTRRFVTSSLDIKHGKQKEFLALHEYAPVHGIGGPEFVAATTTKWTERIYADVVQSKRRRVYELYYTFGPAPRHLSSLDGPDTQAAESTDALTKTFPTSSTQTSHPAIESYITTPDGVTLPYRLEGSSNPNAPLLLLSNSILVDWHIWDDFVSHFLAHASQYRVLRYNTRGRAPLPPSSIPETTIATLTQDILTLLNALRVQNASIVGVSLGGATALHAALSHPTRIPTFIACDTNAVAPPTNRKAWRDRISVSEKEAAKSTSSPADPVVGHDLADLTVRRWFVQTSFASPALLAKIEKTKKMVASNSLDGFRKSVNALYEYDFRPAMRGFGGRGAFLVGAGDGVLPETMAGMARELGGGVELRVVDGAGHLPMVERPEEVAGFVVEVLARGE